MAPDRPQHDGTQSVIDALSRNLVPVRPIPRLRTALVGLSGVWAVVAGAGLWLHGLRPDLLSALLTSHGAAAVFAGLALVAAGGTLASLAMAVPGREPLAWSGLVLACLGLAAAAGLGTLLAAAHSGAAPLRTHAGCLVTAGVLALPPAVALVWFSGRAAVYRPLLAMVAAAAGTAAFGAVVAQAGCAQQAAVHLLLGHALAPVFGVLVLTAPLLLALRRLRRPGGA